MKKYLVAMALILVPVQAQASTIQNATVDSQVAGSLIIETKMGRQMFNTNCDVKFKDGQKVVVVTDGNQRFVVDTETFANIRKDSADVEGALDTLVVGDLACQID